MVLNSQNKANSESNVSKNTLPCRSKSVDGRVEILIRKYERLTSQNNCIRRCCSVQNNKYDNPRNMDYPVLNKNHVRTFLSVSDNISDSSDKMFQKPTLKQKPNKEKAPSTSKRKDDIFSRLFSLEDRREKNFTTLPSRKKPEIKTKNVARSCSASSTDKKLKYLSSNKDNNPKDGGYVQSKLSVFSSTGTVPKQPEDVTYRKRRESYVIATQQESRKLRIYPEKQETTKSSYVGKTISKFESDCFTLPKKKIEQSINSLFQQYHDKKFGTSDKMTREELSLEIDNVLLNNFKQISRDSSPDVEEKTTTPQIKQCTAEITLEIQADVDNVKAEEDVKTEENIDSVVQSTTEDIDDITTTNLYLEIDDTDVNFKGSIENLCENLTKVVSDKISAGSKIEGIVVSVEDMVENREQNENIQETQIIEDQNEEKIERILHVNDNLEFEVLDSEEKTTKVSNLVSYFSGMLSKSNRNSRISSTSNIDEESSRAENIQQNFECSKLFTTTTLKNNSDINFDIDKNLKISKIEDAESSHNEKTQQNFEWRLPSSTSTLKNNSDLICDIDSTGILLAPKIDDVQASCEENSEQNFECSRLSGTSTLKNYSDIISDIDSSDSCDENKEQEIPVFVNTVIMGKSKTLGLDSEEVNISRLSIQEQKELLQNELLTCNSKSYKKQKPRPQSATLTHSRSFKDNDKRFSFFNYIYTEKQSLKNTEKDEQQQEDVTNSNVSRNNSFTEKRNSFLHRNNSDTTKENKARRSRLYSAKFKSNTASTKQDTNNNEELNEEEKILHDKILNDTDFLSDSEGDYDHAEVFNPNFELNSSTNYESSCERIDRFRKVDEQIHIENVCGNINIEENPENVYERLKRYGSTDTVHVVYDEHERAIIRMSIIDLSEDHVLDMIEEMKIHESEKEIMRNIEEIKDPLPNTKKACLINELITTERSYINNSLHRLVHDYMPEMDKEDVPKGLLGKSRQIFGNADLLYEGHKERFLPALESYSTMEDIGLAFLNNEYIFKYYPLYSKNKPKSDIAMKHYNSYFEEKQKELNDKLDLASYLLTPIQRMAKYCQLVGSLVKECEKEQIECKKLKSALEMLSKQMRMGNDLIALDAIEGFNGSILDLGELLLRDVFTVQPPNKKPAFEGMIFLFQRCLMITAIQRQGFKETFLYKESFQLTDLGYSDFSAVEFSVWYRKRDVNMYKFITKSQQLKEKWVKEIFNLLWQQLEANKKRRIKELEANGFKDTRIPLDAKRPFSVPNKESYATVRRKKTMMSSTDTVWYTESEQN